MEVYGLFALITSSISISIYVYRRLFSFNYTEFDAKSMLFSFRISSVSIAKNRYFYRNKCKQLQQYLLEAFEINGDKERCDILPAIPYYDTDIGGLAIYALVTSKMG